MRLDADIEIDSLLRNLREIRARRDQMELIQTRKERTTHRRINSHDEVATTVTFGELRSPALNRQPDRQTYIAVRARLGQLRSLARKYPRQARQAGGDTGSITSVGGVPNRKSSTVNG